ncbi:heavy-metal-associated domain-containing protein [Riemerella anatipestifer]|uniref:heavy-metal-associated domain-containing protein n=1 Tax=Riemerella anatipestifer TaxID=34085 RepID=UPI001374E9C7|nr:heavy metal-associated domain-containing protein [Riemerella anatipestifer]
MSNNTTTHNIEVENIKCGGCMNSIKKAILKMENVETITIDKDTETVTVTGTIDRTSLVDKLSSLGYPEKGNNTILKKAKSFVSCAVGRMSDPVE